MKIGTLGMVVRKNGDLDGVKPVADDGSALSHRRQKKAISMAIPRDGTIGINLGRLMDWP